MKKLFYLFLAITVACSSGDDDGVNDQYNIRYVITYSGDNQNPDEDWGRITYTNSTGNDNEFDISESLWEYEMQVQVETNASFTLYLRAQDWNNFTTTIAQVYLNNQLVAESIGEDGNGAIVYYDIN